MYENSSFFVAMYQLPGPPKPLLHEYLEVTYSGAKYLLSESSSKARGSASPYGHGRKSGLIITYSYIFVTP